MTLGTLSLALSNRLLKEIDAKDNTMQCTTLLHNITVRESSAYLWEKKKQKEQHQGFQRGPPP